MIDSDNSSILGTSLYLVSCTAYISNNLTLDSTINNATGSPEITLENGDMIITLG